MFTLLQQPPAIKRSRKQSKKTNGEWHDEVQSCREETKLPSKIVKHHLHINDYAHLLNTANDDTTIFCWNATNDDNRMDRPRSSGAHPPCSVQEVMVGKLSGGGLDGPPPQMCTLCLWVWVCIYRQPWEVDFIIMRDGRPGPGELYNHPSLVFSYVHINPNGTQPKSESRTRSRLDK